ncbi:hypothetical protein [Flavobacterium faecale]|uniref:hypothetical protein n=1 Tax=Flavobacterium faecale TaxID=1355330 RepID=UPI003AAC6159
MKQLSKKDKEPGNSQIMETLGYTYRGSYYNTNNKNQSFHYDYSNTKGIIINKIHGYDFAFEITNNQNNECKDCFTFDGKSYSINYKETDYGIELKINDEIIPLKTHDFVLKNKTSLDKNHEKIVETISTDHYDILLNYQSLNGEIKETEIKLNWFTINVLLKIK